MNTKWTTRDVRRYIFRGMNGVRGYMHPADALLFATILDGQTASGTVGSVAEIGVFFGRSFFLLAKMISPGEKAIGFDLFDIGPKRGEAVQPGTSFQRAEFDRMAAQLGVDMTDNIIVKGDTAELDAQDVRRLLGKVRFFHIDGGHMRANLVADTTIALDSITDDGVICFDDFFNAKWPEVTAYVLELLQERPDLQPFVTTLQKMYICRREFVQTYQAMIDRSAFLSKLTVLPISLDGHHYKLFYDNGFRKVRYRLLAQSPLAPVNALFY